MELNISTTNADPQPFDDVLNQCPTLVVVCASE